jgi:hypothetical protein
MRGGHIAHEQEAPAFSEQSIRVALSFERARAEAVGVGDAG